MNIVRHKHNLMISFSDCSSHPGKYSYEISHKSYQDEGTSREIISINRNLYSNLGFFSNSDFPPRIGCDFFRTVLYLEKLLLHTFSE